MNKKINKLRNSLNLDFFSPKPEEILRDRKQCPTPEELLESFSPEASAELKKKIIDHLIECPACRSEFELLRASREFISRAERVLSPKKGLSHRIESVILPLKPFWKLATVFSLALFLIIFLYLQTPRWSFLHLERGLVNEQVFMMQENLTFEPLKISLTWEAIPEALFYRVEVFDEKMSLVWQSPPVYQTRLDLPFPVLEALKSSDHFYWQVLAQTSGQKIYESPARKALLAPQNRQ